MKGLNMQIFQRFLKKKKATLQLYPDDVFLVSYPKSGNSWVRFMLGNYLSQNKCGFDNCNLLVPDVHVNPSDCENLKRPRVIKSHFEFVAEYPKVVYLVRDGRDVAVSYFYHQKKERRLGPETDFPAFLKKFNMGDNDMFGLWGAHVLSWLGNKHKDILVVSYEDLIDDPVRCFSSILSFCNIEVFPEKVKEAVVASSFKNMQRLEREQQASNVLLANSDESIPFVRKGSTSQWCEYFNDELLHEFMLHHGEAMRRLGYDS